MDSRRQFLKKAPLVMAAVWVVPQIISVDVAAAQSHAGSRPPTSNPPPRQNQPPVNTPTPQMGPGIPEGIPAQLPFTGDDLEKPIVIGAAIAAAGAGLIAYNREKEVHRIAEGLIEGGA